MPGRTLCRKLRSRMLALAFARAAVFMAVWTAIVSASDNFLRPYLTRQRASVSTLTVFVGVIGGVAAFGFIGSLIGPVVVALIVALLRFAEQEVRAG